MPRKKIVTTKEEETTVEPETPPEAPQDELIRSFVERFGGDAVGRVVIYRVDPRGKREYLGSVAADVVDEDFLQRTYGGGRFYVRLVDDRGQYLQQMTCDIAELPGAAQAAPPGAESDGARLQLDILREQVARQHEMILQLVTSRNSGGGSINEIVAAVAELKKMSTNGGPSDTEAAIKTTLDALRSGIQIAQNAQGQKDNKEIWLDVVERGLALLPQVLSRLPLSTGRPGAAAGEPNGARAADPNATRELLAQGLAYLKSKARAGKDPDLYIDLIVENLDEPQWLGLARELTAGGFDGLAAVDPEISHAPYEVWFRRLYEGVKDALTADSGAHSDRPARDDRNAAADESASKRESA
jgi:hypothetical protein